MERIERCSCAREWGEPEALRWWRENGPRVAQLRSRPGPASASPLPTVAVSLEGRLAGAGR
jgi:hypothetical protein